MRPPCPAQRRYVLVTATTATAAATAATAATAEEAVIVTVIPPSKRILQNAGPPATTTSSSQASPFPHHPPPPPPNLLTNTAALRQAIHGNLHQIVDHIEGMQWQGCLMLVSAVLAVQQNVGDSIFSGVLGGQGSARGEWQDFLLTQLGIWKDELRGVERVSSDVIVRGGDGGSGGGSGRDPGDKRNCQTRRWKEEVGENGLVILDFTGDDDSDNKG
ncbi:MAG: hypothetical protein M1834_000993 [Cirrosporium novae-zelandiae]|nr:MAG: hypothetical protein M1834_000993 [Cirrosporium novae-zelandiae]